MNESFQLRKDIDFVRMIATIALTTVICLWIGLLMTIRFIDARFDKIEDPNKPPPIFITEED